MGFACTHWPACVCVDVDCLLCRAPLDVENDVNSSNTLGSRLFMLQLVKLNKFVQCHGARSSSGLSFNRTITKMLKLTVIIFLN